MNHIKHLPYQTRKQKLCKTKDKKKKKKMQLDSTICNVKNAWNLPDFWCIFKFISSSKITITVIMKT